MLFSFRKQLFCWAVLSLLLVTDAANNLAPIRRNGHGRDNLSHRNLSKKSTKAPKSAVGSKKAKGSKSSLLCEENEFRSTFIASVGGDVVVGGVTSTNNPFDIDTAQSMIQVTPDGTVDASVVGLFRSADPGGLAQTYEELFLSFSCGGNNVVFDSAPVMAAIDDNFNVDPPTVVNFSFQDDDLATFLANCDVTPIVLVRRNGCTTASGCGGDDPDNKKWLARTGVNMCDSDSEVDCPADGTTFNLSASQGTVSGNRVTIDGVRSTGTSFTINDNSFLTITEDGDLLGLISGLQRSTDDPGLCGVTYDEVFVSLACLDTAGVPEIVSDSSPFRLDQTDCTVDIFEEAFGVDSCLGPILLVRRNNLPDNTANTLWLAISSL